MESQAIQKRILFVDDEPQLLAGLRRALRSQRNAWDMHFVESGEKALRLMGETSFDAVVSDMRMPGMDGAALLREIAHRKPSTIRIVLSGQSDQATILSLVGTAHQFLAKPCDTDTLIALLRRSLALQTMLTDERLLALIATVDTLPSIPALYCELTRRLESEDTTVREIGRLIAEDPPMTAKLLQLVNSAFFGVGRHISNPKDAATLLGMDTLRALVLSVGIFRQFETKQSAAAVESLQRLWQHSVVVGRLSQDIAAAEGCDRATVDDAMTAGLLHDIGRLVIAFRMPDAGKQIDALVQSETIDYWDAEERVVGTTHNAIGAYLLGLWGIPSSVVEAVAFNHRPLCVPSRNFGPLTAVHVADALSQGRSPESKYLEELGLADHLVTWRGLTEGLPLSESL